MKNIYKNYLIMGLTILVVVLLVIIILLVLNKPNFSFLNNSDKNESHEVNNKNNSDKDVNDDLGNDNQDLIDNNIESNESLKNDTTTNSNSNINTNSSNGSNQGNNDSNSNASTSNNVTEDDIVAYFQNEENSFSTYNDQNNSSLREKAKAGFITIIDFIFYGKEIKGYTFEGLTNSAKLKIVKIALTIDHKIEEYFPNYKTIIKDKYNDIKGKLAVKYLELTSSLCDKVGVDTCNQFKEDFNNMKNSFGFTWSLLKELTKSGKNSIKEYYENEFRTN